MNNIAAINYNNLLLSVKCRDEYTGKKSRFNKARLFKAIFIVTNYPTILPY